MTSVVVPSAAMRLVFTLVLTCGFGCASSRSGGDDDAGELDASVDAAYVPDTGIPDAEALPDAQVPDDDVIVWAHSADALFSFDPRTNTVTEIARFTLTDGTVAPDMTDLAV